MTLFLDPAGPATTSLVQKVRQQFPALSRQGNRRGVSYLDGPAGTQVPERVARAVSDYLLCHNANSHGAFLTSRETDQLQDRARSALCDLMQVSDPDEFVFGPNMTTLTMSMS